MEKEYNEKMPTDHSGIVGMFFQVVDDLHYHHLNTRSYAEHKALEHAYEEMVDYKDEVAEKLIGYLGRLSKIRILPLPNCELDDLPEDIMEAASALRELATKNKYNDLVNLSDEITGVGSKLRYLLTLN